MNTSTAASSLLLYIKDWVETYILNWHSLLQVIVIMAVIAVVFAVANKASLWLAHEERGKRVRSTVSFLARHIHLSIHEMLLLLLAPLLLGSVVLITTVAGWPDTFLRIMANLMTAWAFIRLSSSIIQQRFWSMALAFSIWIITALNILGWLQPTISMLDAISVNLGDMRLSLLLVIKGILISGLLIWGAGLLADRVEKIIGAVKDFTPSQKVLFFKVIRIMLFTVAVLLSMKSVGIDLTALAVFTGAVGIGIGFGLQKVFSNIISGFILLLDKSIKPGDVIAVENTYGWVNFLGTRHVSILTRDGKEHLIPNEKFITEPVENWSYSDNKLRLHIPIGVSYNSDIHLVKRILLEVVDALPRILKNPAPTCPITGFGDNSVNFEIRIWIEDPANGITNVSSLVYEGVWDAFKKHNIEIPFPQRDVHIRNVPKEMYVTRG